MMNIHVKIFIVFAIAFLTASSFAATSAQADVRSSAEYKRLEMAFLATSKENAVLQKRVDVLQKEVTELRGAVAAQRKIEVHAELTPEDRVQLNRLLKQDIRERWIYGITAAALVVLSFILLLIILALSLGRSRWKAKALRLER